MNYHVRSDVSKENYTKSLTASELFHKLILALGGKVASHDGKRRDQNRSSQKKVDYYFELQQPRILGCYLGNENYGEIVSALLMINKENFAEQVRDKTLHEVLDALIETEENSKDLTRIVTDSINNASKKFKKDYSEIIDDLKNNKKQIINTYEHYDFFFLTIEEGTHILQRLNDKALLDVGHSLPSDELWLYIRFLLIHICLEVHSKNSLYIKTFPLIYIRTLLNSYANNNFNLLKTINQNIKNLVDKLKGNRQASDFVIYEHLRKITSGKIPTFANIDKQISDLKRTLSERPSRKKLTTKEKEIIEKLQGTYHALVILLRFHRKNSKTPMHEIECQLKITSKISQVLELPYIYAGLLDPYPSSESCTNVDDRKRFSEIYLNDYGLREDIAMELGDRTNNELNSLVTLFLKYRKTHTNLYRESQFNASESLKLKHLEQTWYCTLINNYLDERIGIFDLFDEYEIDILIVILDKYCGKHDASKILSQAFQNIKNRQIDDAIYRFKKYIELDSTLYSLKRLASVFWIGLYMYSGKKITPNIFKAPLQNISAYVTEISKVHNLDPSATPSSAQEQKIIRESNRQFLEDLFYENDDGYTFLLAIKTYNYFLEKNELAELKANPVKKSIKFLKAFFDSYDALDISKTDDFDALLLDALNHCDTKYVEPKSPWSGLSLSLLKSRWIFEKLNINLEESEDDIYIKTINRFFDLTAHQRDKLIKLCIEKWGTL